MLTSTEEYAMRAMIFIATHTPGEFTLTREIGQRLNIPQLYLSKILQTLARQGLLKSQRGRKGGFVLARPSTEISFMDIMDAVAGGDRFRQCILGYAECKEEDPCPFHKQWAIEKERIVKLFTNTSLATLAKAYRPVMDLAPDHRATEDGRTKKEDTERNSNQINLSPKPYYQTEADGSI